MSQGLRVVVFKGNWPIPSASPACLKLLTWLRIAGLDYETEAPKGRPQSKTGKAQYILRPDGAILDDSSVIIDVLTQEHGITLDAQRSARERALMTLVQRTVENHLYFVGLLHRWRDNWPATRAAYFDGVIPRPILTLVAPFIRRSTLAQAHGQGLGRRPREEVVLEAIADLEALAEILGEDNYFFGSPGVTDAIVYGALENARACPLSGEAKDFILGSGRLLAYLDRIKSRYWDTAKH